MTPPQFYTGSNDAYLTLGALAANQRWYAFDTPIEFARKGKARLFVMTVWNDRDPKYPDTPRPIRRDLTTGDYWYKVPREKEGERASQNRKSLWTGIDIAQQFQLPMTAVLKDRKSRKCSLAHTFRIGEVRYELDGSALWLKLISRTGAIGAEIENDDLSHLITLPTSNGQKPVVQSFPPSSGQGIDYAYLCEVAAQVESGELKYEAAVVLLQRLEIDTSVARALLENYQCLVRGNEIKHSTTADVVEILADNIIALYGGKALENVISAVKAHVELRANSNATELRKMCGLLEVLKSDWMAFQGGSAIEAAIQSATKNSEHGVSDQASEILREVWVRGPQHAAFRRALKRRWKETCSVHGAACDGQLRASHIVAWRLEETLRGDLNNGLLLSVPLDSLFDRGLISFDDTGRLLRSKLLSDDTAIHFGVLPNLRLAWDDFTNRDRERIRTHLKRHRKEHAAIHSYEN